MCSVLDKADYTKRLQLTENDCIQLLHRVETIIDETCDECGYDKSNLKPSNWSYILHQIGFNLFRVHPYLINDYTRIDINNTPLNNNNKYRSITPFIPENIEIIYDTIYKPLCEKYNQYITVEGLCKLLYIQSSEMFTGEYIYTGFRKNKDIEDTVRYRLIKIGKKIKRDGSDSLRNLMFSSNQNPVKYIAIGNRYHGWSEQERPQIEEYRPAISIEDIPEIGTDELTDNLLLPDFGDDQ